MTGGDSVRRVCGWRDGSQYLGRTVRSGLCSARILTPTANVDSEQGQPPLEHFVSRAGEGTRLRQGP